MDTYKVDIDKKLKAMDSILIPIAKTGHHKRHKDGFKSKEIEIKETIPQDYEDQWEHALEI